MSPPARLFLPKAPGSASECSGWTESSAASSADGQAASASMKCWSGSLGIWKARHYKCDPARPIRFRFTTLRRLYYPWRDSGRTPDALALHYWRGNRKASISQVVELSKLCLAPETKSLSAAYRTLKSPIATHWAYRKAMPSRLKAALAALLAHRRRGLALERAARRLLEGLAK